MIEKHQYAYQVNTYITDYIKFGDAKAGSVLAFISLVIGGMAPFLSKVIDDLNINNSFFLKITITIFLLFYAGSLALVIWHSLRALSPCFYKTEETLNSFPHISEFVTDSTYVKKFEQMSTSDIEVHYSRHNWALAKTASQKFTEITKSLFYLKVSLALTAVPIIFYIVIKIL